MPFVYDHQAVAVTMATPALTTLIVLLPELYASIVVSVDLTQEIHQLPVLQQTTVLPMRLSVWMAY
jgi:hypothetical protein